ncbi:hypothetical protein XH99_29795 [Bradyrhizobium nanningense]|uniref:Uncharacterized protein n=1 Tax=Bradyrhizobium nanningense TaxID=1325118 RepID=A0A4Q0RY30_9BRAD|nr:hypothetical protein [Bradyrhizobium nanningense]RXH23670.1 hypothetical protein XH99_29795 [Bradyrhizobium nanningense]RXH31153.1 hypothetical protein XH84_15485 [Bradyrhizobium nanningense]
MIDRSPMAGSDASLWPVVVGGLLTLAGTAAGSVVTIIREIAQHRREAKKRRADKLEELVAAIYDFDHWLDGIQSRRAYGEQDVPVTVSPFAKLQAITSIYFPRFSIMVAELDIAASQRQVWISQAAGKRLDNDIANLNIGQSEAYRPYAEEREALLAALGKFAREELQ